MMKRWVWAVGFVLVPAALAGRVWSEPPSGTAPIIKKVIFKGAKHLKEDELRELTGVSAGRPLNPLNNKLACKKITARLNEMGRPFASCTLLKGGELGDTEVIFDITEGPTVKVKDIQFVGTTFVSDARLATQIHSSIHFSSGWFHAPGGTYSPQMAEADVNELIKYFRSLGFGDVRVSLETCWDSDPSLVTLIFFIDEGPRYRKEDSAKGPAPKSVPSALLEELSRVKPAEYYDRPETGAGCIKTYISSSGREAKVEPAAQAPPASGQEIKEPPARVGQIFIKGNKRVSTTSILAHLPLYPGQVLVYADLEKMEKKLADLDLFVVDPQAGIHPTVTVLDSESESVFKDIIITVEEKPTNNHGCCKSH